VAVSAKYMDITNITKDTDESKNVV